MIRIVPSKIDYSRLFKSIIQIIRKVNHKNNDKIDINVMQAYYMK